MDSDRRRWDERWNAADDSADAIIPTPPDVVRAHRELLDVLPSDGAGLDLACGIGAQALWMAERGLQVTALDVSGVAIELVRKAAVARGLQIEASVQDTDDGLPIDLDELALIICQRYRSTGLYGELVRRLRPGGCLVLTVLSAVGLRGTPGPFHAPPGELTDAFRDAEAEGVVDVLVDDEGDGQASIVLRRRAR